MKPNFLKRTCVFCCLLACIGLFARAQSANAVPQFDQNSLTGSWYEIARLPNRREKHCANDAIELIALGDKTSQLQIVDGCNDVKGYKDSWNFTAVMKKKSSSGGLKVRSLPLNRKYWILALGPVVPVSSPLATTTTPATPMVEATANPASDNPNSVQPDADKFPALPTGAGKTNVAPPPPSTGYAWTLIGTPNHKQLWIFSRTTTLNDATLAQIKAQAISMGYKADKLIGSPQSSSQTEMKK